eukprot:316389-Hanusia_phi.AAC.4
MLQNGQARCYTDEGAWTSTLVAGWPLPGAQHESCGVFVLSHGELVRQGCLGRGRNAEEKENWKIGAV